MALSETYDLICVGSGAAGSAAALAGAELGLSVCLLEKASHLGGGSAYSTGGLWAGNNHLARAAGITDSREETLAYMAFVSGGAALPENLAAYIDQAPAAIQAFETMGVRFHLRPAVPDHFYPSAPGSKAGGRTMGCAPLHRSALGPWRDRLMESSYFTPGISNLDISDWGGLGNMRNWDPELIEARRRSGVLGTGQAVVGQFLAGVVRRHVAIACDSPVEALVVEDGRVVGVLVSRNGNRVRIGTRRGVVLATGGYEGNPELVARFEAVPVPEWRSMFPPDVAGDGLVMATEIGAALYRIPENYFLFLGYDIPQADGTSTYRMTGFTELTFPHTIVVNRSGQRFFDESSFQKGVLAIKAFDTATHTYPNSAVLDDLRPPICRALHLCRPGAGRRHARLGDPLANARWALRRAWHRCRRSHADRCSVQPAGGGGRRPRVRPRLVPVGQGDIGRCRPPDASEPGSDRKAALLWRAPASERVEFGRAADRRASACSPCPRPPDRRPLRLWHSLRGG